MTEAPVAPPGKEFHYSNTGFMLAAVIAEHVTGTPYEALMRSEVFTPLGMNGVQFGVPSGAGEPSGHSKDKVAGLLDGNPAMFAPAGNISMSLSDWAKFCIDQLAGATGGGRLLSQSDYKLMQSPLANTGNGLDWGYNATLAGREGPVLTHAGSDGNWESIVALFPATQSGILVNANAGEDMGGETADKTAFKAILPQITQPAPAAK